LETQVHMISTHLVGGQHEVRVYADGSPGSTFRLVDSSLEDVYFLNLSQQAKRQLPN
jgi:ABC-2 type transport system ATP-binding protein